MHVRRAAGWLAWVLLCVALTGSTPVGVGVDAAKQARAVAPPVITRLPQPAAALTVHDSIRAMVNSIERLPSNITAFHWINGNHSPALDRFFLFFRVFGSGWFIFPVLLLALFRRRDLVMPLVIGIVLETLVVLLLKLYLQQPRPVLVLGQDNIHLLVHYRNNSFPSGDAAMAFVLAGVMMFRAHWGAKIAWLFYALLIAYGRVYLGVHFPLDVTVGALVGLFAAAIALRSVRRQPAVPVEEAPMVAEAYGEEEYRPAA